MRILPLALPLAGIAVLAPHAGAAARPFARPAPAVRLAAPPPADSAHSAIRVNLVGYLPDAPKVAVACSTVPRVVRTFHVVAEDGRTVLGPLPAVATGEFGPCASTHRLDFSALRRSGTYRVVAAADTSPAVHIGPHVWRGAADTLLAYIREQRSGWNPVFRDSVHARTDAILVDHPDSGRFIPVAGGWADAADYLQYVTTSGHATFVLLQAYRDHPGAFADRFRANGAPGANGVPDVLDEARHGLEWLVEMYPRPDLLLNQIGDDRDHAFPDLPTNDSSDYGWGRGGFRPVYPCTGRPQGLLGHMNRSTGLASTAGKFTAAMALGARLLRSRDAALADTLARKAREAYALGLAHPGVCQTAPGRAPYFYEEDDWVDDMELAAAELYATSRRPALRRAAARFAAEQPVKPWMGADTARHYEWFPFLNDGHYELWREVRGAERDSLAGYYRRGLERLADHARNGFRIGVPFIWVSNDLVISTATQAYLYRRMTGDHRYRWLEQAALDWLFGANPWGTSFVIGYPAGADTPTDPHSIVSERLGAALLTGGVVDGPVYRSIYANLLGIRLLHPDEYAPWNTGFIVYHDDLGDYSTNEPVTDVSADLVYLLSALGDGR